MRLAARLSSTPVRLCVRLSTGLVMDPEGWRHEKRQRFGHNAQGSREAAGEFSVHLNVDAGVGGALQPERIGTHNGHAFYVRQSAGEDTEQVLHVWKRVRTFEHDQFEHVTEERCSACDPQISAVVSHAAGEGEAA